MYRKYRIVESILSNVSQYKSYRDQVYHYTPNDIFLVMLLAWVILEEFYRKLIFLTNVFNFLS